MLEPERRSALARPDREERIDAEHVPPSALPASDAVKLAQLLEGVDADVRVGADAQADTAVQHAFDRQEAVAEIRLGREAGADPRAGLGEQVELAAVGVRRVHDRRARP